MIIFRTANPLSEFVVRERKKGRSIGFVPTMGALHEGHLTLLRASKSNGDLTICSIFVNPRQFNNPEDFRLYPVTIEKDIEWLERSGCEVLFLPSVDEIYPTGYQAPVYDLGDLERVWEGRYRPGHFQGVCQVMDRLLTIVQPDHLYLGQKDFQQCMVISRLIRLMGKEPEIRMHIVPTVREKDGLAMSSRNLRLDQQQRSVATAIHKELQSIKENLGKQAPEKLRDQAKQQLQEKGFVVDYIALVHSGDLSPAGTDADVVLAAATIGSVRLIDNLLLR